MGLEVGRLGVCRVSGCAWVWMSMVFYCWVLRLLYLRLELWSFVLDKGFGRVSQLIG